MYGMLLLVREIVVWLFSFAKYGHLVIVNVVILCMSCCYLYKKLLSTHLVLQKI